MKVLVTGGVRSGKSRHAEQLLVGYDAVTYVAPGPTTQEDPDPDWAARIAAHQERRSASWRTLETRHLTAALGVPGPVLVDCLGSWLTATIDAATAWDAPSAEAHALVDERLEAVAAALRATTSPVVRDERGGARRGARAPLRAPVPGPARRSEPASGSGLRRGAPRRCRPGAGALTRTHRPEAPRRHDSRSARPPDGDDGDQGGDQ
jgi:adenosylcobinamide kinase/adenosylcobinamide-phosphate guanylyltransferase